MQIATSSQLVWAKESSTASGPNWRQEEFNGSCEDAVNHLVPVTKEDGFLLGQVLRADGSVFATLGKNGAVKFAPTAP